MAIINMNLLHCEIADVPETRLKLGSSLSGDHVKEGSDVYFDCVIDANPPVSKVDWRHSVSSITHPSGFQLLPARLLPVEEGIGFPVYR